MPDAPGFPLPPSLEPLRERLAATLRPAAYFSLADDAPATRTGSQMGGVPYWPEGRPWPVARRAPNVPPPLDGRGARLLRFLVQLALAEAPALPGLPRTGLLQVFISDDDLYGCPMDETTPLQTTWRLVYHATADAPAADLPEDMTPLADADLFPLDDAARARRIVFEPQLRYEPVNTSSHAFRDLIGDPNAVAETLAGGPGAEARTLSDALFGLSMPGMGLHKLGGWPDFSQGDPSGRDGRERVLLLQIDSAPPPRLDLMWGDLGSAQFLIEPDCLARWDLSNVLYDWACG